MWGHRAPKLWGTAGGIVKARGRMGGATTPSPMQQLDEVFRDIGAGNVHPLHCVLQNEPVDDWHCVCATVATVTDQTAHEPYIQANV